MPERLTDRQAARILLVDDHQIMRDGLRLTLEQHPELKVVGEAGDGKTALQQMERVRPSLIVMDVGLPDADGIALSRDILARWPAVRVVILSGVADHEHLDAAMEAGVSGYVLKVNAASELVRAIHMVMRGETYLSPEVSAVLVAGYRRLRKAGRSEVDSELTPRERQVVKMIADGRNTKEIAAALSLSVKTVETHRTRLMAKLGLNSVAELTKYAIRHGITSV